MKIFISANLKNYRQKKHLTQKQVGDILAVSPQAVSKWERGVAYPDLCLLPDVAKLLSCTVDELLTGILD